jgi:MFS-type transporter involved in bile tolerance (Atg22 family)
VQKAKKKETTMSAFNSAYPWLVLIIGAATALIAVLDGLAAALVIGLGRWTDDTGARVFWVAASTAIGNVSAIVLLAFTKWMLA